MSSQQLFAGSLPAWAQRLFRWTAILLGAVYLVNCCTPLRFHIDMLRYFAIKDCIELHCPPGSDAANDYMPAGYTVLLLALSRLGILKSWTIVLINCAYLAGSLYLLMRMCRNGLRTGVAGSGSSRSYLYLVIVLLNWTLLKFVAHPLSEMQYLFFSTLALYYFQRFTDTGKLLLVLPAFGAAAIAFLTRSVGVSLVAALVIALLFQYRKELIVLVRRNKALVGLVVLGLAGVALFSRQLGLDHYTGVFTKQFQGGVSWGTMLQWHFREWAETGLNISIVKVPGVLPASVIRGLFLLVGIFFVVTFIRLLLSSRVEIPVVIRVYLICYILLLFNWPFYDPRFWVPVLPMIGLVVVTCPSPAWPWLRKLVWAYGLCYALLGTLAIGYFTRTSLDRRLFARTQANGAFRSDYETFFYGKPQSDTARKADPFLLNLLRRYDR